MAKARYVLAAMAAFAAVVCMATSVQAAIIVQYAFPAANDMSPTVEHSNVTGGNVTSAGSTLIVNVGLLYSTAPVLQANPAGTVSDVVDNAFTNSNYFSITITPDAGYEMDLSTLTFNAARGGSSTTRRTGVRTSLTGTTNLLSTAVTPVRPNWPVTPYTVDLSAYSALQNVTGPVSIMFAVATPSTGNSLEFDDITISGTVTPEPATLTLLGFGAGLTMVMRRRRHA